MCTMRSPVEVMVCDVARDGVRDRLVRDLGDGFSFQTVHGEGTLISCLNPGLADRFLEVVDEARAEIAAGEDT